MDTRFVESFVTVVEKGSIAEAARRLNLTPAGVAQQLRALEREIGKPIVARTGRTVVPTEIGTAMLDGARALLRQARDLKAVTTDERPTGELRLGAPAAMLSGVLPQILVPFVAKYPQVKIYLVPGFSVDLYHTVLRGDLDAVVTVKPRFPIPKVFSWTLLRSEQLVVVTPVSMQVDDPHDILMREPFIRYDRKNWGGHVVDQYLKHAGLNPKERFELSAIDAIAALVAQGLGVSLVPEWPSPWNLEQRIRKLPIADETHRLHIGLLAANMSPNARLARLFRAEAIDVLGLCPAQCSEGHAAPPLGTPPRT